MSADCIFCKIISGVIPANKIYEDEDVIVFNDIKPMSVLRHHDEISRLRYQKEQSDMQFARAAMMESEDNRIRQCAVRRHSAFRTLGLKGSELYSASALKRAYVAKMKTAHPDHGGSEASLRAVISAFEYLKKEQSTTPT